MVKLLLMRFLSKPRPPIQEGKFPDISLYDKSLFSKFWLFCAGKEPVNLLLPRNLKIGMTICKCTLLKWYQSKRNSRMIYYKFWRALRLNS
nr:hypothetical protein Iba_chr01aCG10240 [Ipomoea batatas]